MIDFVPTAEVKLWRVGELRSFILKVRNSGNEDNWFDFKEKITGQTAKEVCKDFASLANIQGGYLIYGVRDSNLEVIGCDSLTDLHTLISTYLDPNIIDPGVNWSLVNSISLRSKKIVYIIHIDASLIFNKPHFVTGTVYVRDKGLSRPIKHLSEFRQCFTELKDFQPGHINNFLHIVEWLKSNDYRWMALDCLSCNYLHHLKNYLIASKQYSSLDVKTQTDSLLAKLEKITSWLSDIEKSRSIHITETQSFFINNDIEINELIDSVETDINEFIRIFKEVFHVL